MDEKEDPQPRQEERKSYLHVECKPAEKGRYIQAAKRKNMKMNAWILETLNAEIDKNKQ
ncbi:hypothetical protein [Nitrosomonas ureae]|uniref:HicB family protein n=1 Tax=Nitrosomonas ureae TaxID=44577 RepID=A0A1H2EP84_9PROT|nr:hypothetical protein [Nitrosomonas ureae]SDT96763.1 hypothetical protein SAMN05216406_11437 [Nitrosomonas ureae]